MSLDDASIERYSRHILLPEIGGLGQERLLTGRVAIVGRGPGAESAAMYLAAAGVGEIFVEPAVAADCGQHVANMNPDSRLSVGPAPSEVMRVEVGQSRAQGAMAAMRAIVELSQAGEYSEWTYDRGGFRWSP